MLSNDVLFMRELMSDAAPAQDPRQAKYELAERLIDNIRFGEAIRILEELGDYRNSLEMLAEARRLKAYLDDQDAKQKAERKRQIEERDRQEAAAHRRRVILWTAACVAGVIAMVLLR